MAQYPFRCVLACAVTGLLACMPAAAQSDEPAIIVANNGNLEGAVASLKVAGDGSLSFVQKLTLGTRPNLQSPCPQCNAYSISMTPNGRYVALGHASSDDALQRVTVVEINADTTLTQIGTFPVPDSPLSLQWLSDTRLAVMGTDGGGSHLEVYDFDAVTPALTEVGTYSTGGFSTSVAVHPSGDFAYTQNSSNRSIYALAVVPDGSLSEIEIESVSPPFPLELAVSPNGRWLYAAGGISDGGRRVMAYAIQADGSLVVVPGSPFSSPGASPSNTAVDPANRILLVGHGTDATVRTFEIDGVDGSLTATAFSFDVGLQGSLGDVQAGGGYAFVSDNTTAIDGVAGVYSFTLGADGSLTQNGPIVSITVNQARAIAVWFPPAGLLGDMNCDGVVSVGDINAFVLALTDPNGYAAQFPDCNINNADFNDDGGVTVGDINGFVDAVTG